MMITPNWKKNHNQDASDFVPKTNLQVIPKVYENSRCYP